jgi:endonuclease/exonuclease/phosphatase family metal-dependent hydrolase
MNYLQRFTAILLTVALLAAIGDAATIRLMTYNIRLDIASDGANAWKNRKEFLTGQIRFFAPDIFGVQEALPNQIEDISTALPAFGHIGIGRDGEGKGEASSIYYDRTRFRVSSAATFWLSETPDRVSKGWDASYIRVCTYGLFTDRRTKRRFWVFNTHLDNAGAVARKKGLELIVARIEKVNKQKLPVFLMGDFNAEPDSEPIQFLRTKMTDARAASSEPAYGPRGTFNGFKFENPVTNLIDYIFIDNPSRITVRKFGVLSDSIDKRFPSDHFPVLIEAEIRK